MDERRGAPSGPGAGRTVASAGRVERWTIPPRAEELRLLRTQVRAVTQAWGMHEDDAEDLLIVVIELVSNSIEHTGTTSRLLLRRLPDAVHVIVADDAPDGPQLRPHDVTAARGRGLQMVDRLAAHWGWAERSGGKLIWATLRPDQQ